MTTTPLNRSLEPLGVSIPSKVPTHWYNLAADLPRACSPRTCIRALVSRSAPEDLAPLFPMNLIAQEVATERYIEIPETVREIYGMWRPSPLFRAHRLERALGTPARIYYKYEGVSPVGSHKPNTAVAQAYYNAIEGTTKLTTETGAGQWGVRRCRSRARCSDSTSRYGRFARPSIRSRTDASRWRRTAESVTRRLRT